MFSHVHAIHKFGCVTCSIKTLRDQSRISSDSVIHNTTNTKVTSDLPNFMKQSLKTNHLSLSPTKLIRIIHYPATSPTPFKPALLLFSGSTKKLFWTKHTLFPFPQLLDLLTLHRAAVRCPDGVYQNSAVGHCRQEHGNCCKNVGCVVVGFEGD
jgi:hypothetical protein